MTGSLFYVVIFIILMMIGGSLGSILIGFGGAPGAFLAMGDRDSSAYRVRWWLGLFISAIGQAIVSLALVAVVVSLVRYAVSQPNTWAWVLWVVGFFVAISPGASAASQSRMEQRENPEMIRNHVLHLALGLTCIIDPVGYIVFAIFPNVMSRLFSWLPYVSF